VNRATGLLARASRVQMGREDIVRRLMQIYLSQGQPADALQAYRRLEAYQIASTGSFRPPEDLRHLAAESGYTANLPALYSR
jgi:DNA-binding SARP family transcriptional activator